MTGHCEFLGWLQGMKSGEHLDRIAVELHVLAALDLNDLTFRNAVCAHDIGVSLRAYDHGACFLGNIGNIGDVIPMAVTNQNVIHFFDLLVDHRFIHLNPSRRIELSSKETSRDSLKVRIDEDCPIAETDFPPVGAKPLEIHAGCAGTTILVRRLSAIGYTGEEERSRTRCPSHETCA